MILSSLESQNETYDMIILGAGPAGLTAAIYACRANLKTLVLESMLSGGEITATDQLDNYPGFPEGISGAEFGERLEKQAKRFGAELNFAAVEKVELEAEIKRVFTAQGEFHGRTVLIATGTAPRTLGVPGEEKLRGRGISFCATCDGPFFREKRVAVIGRGDSAVEEALYLTRFVDKIDLIHRRENLRAIPSLQEKMFSNPKIEFHKNCVVKEFGGEQKVEKIIVENLADSSIKELPADGAFLYVGRIPNVEFIEGIEKDAQGFIITNEEMETALPGVFAAGDIRRKYLRQVLTAAADGAIAAAMSIKYLS